MGQGEWAGDGCDVPWARPVITTGNCGLVAAVLPLDP
jgi:hypothetical protein